MSIENRQFNLKIKARFAETVLTALENKGLLTEPIIEDGVHSSEKFLCFVISLNNEQTVRIYEELELFKEKNVELTPLVNTVGDGQEQHPALDLELEDLQQHLKQVEAKMLFWEDLASVAKKMFGSDEVAKVIGRAASTEDRGVWDPFPRDVIESIKNAPTPEVLKQNLKALPKRINKNSESQIGEDRFKKLKQILYTLLVVDTLE